MLSPQPTRCLSPVTVASRRGHVICTVGSCLRVSVSLFLSPLSFWLLWFRVVGRAGVTVSNLSLSSHSLVSFIGCHPDLALAFAQLSDGFICAPCSFFLPLLIKFSSSFITLLLRRSSLHTTASSRSAWCSIVNPNSRATSDNSSGCSRLFLLSSRLSELIVLHRVCRLYITTFHPFTTRHRLSHYPSQSYHSRSYLGSRPNCIASFLSKRLYI